MMKGTPYMNKKIFFVTIPMQNPADLKPLKYRKEDKGEIFSEPSRFPGIPFLDWSIIGDEEVKLITVRTDDDRKNTEKNYEKFKEELAALSERLGRNIEIDAEIILPHEENREKQIVLLKELCAQYEENSDIYMELTYGTKVTPIGMFSSLTYAEKVKHCNIKSVIYGKYSFKGDIGDLYDVRCLYEMTGIINAAEYLPDGKIESLLGGLWG